MIYVQIAISSNDDLFLSLIFFDRQPTELNPSASHFACSRFPTANVKIIKEIKSTKKMTAKNTIYVSLRANGEKAKRK